MVFVSAFSLCTELSQCTRDHPSQHWSPPTYLASSMILFFQTQAHHQSFDTLEIVIPLKDDHALRVLLRSWSWSTQQYWRIQTPRQLRQTDPFRSEWFWVMQINLRLSVEWIWRKSSWKGYDRSPLETQIIARVVNQKPGSYNKIRYGQALFRERNHYS
jgi:hypothetical protein